MTALLVLMGLLAVVAAVCVLIDDRHRPEVGEFDDLVGLERQRQARAALRRATRTEDPCR